MWGNKTSPSKFKRIQVIQNMFSNYNGIKLEINNRKTVEKFPNIWQWNNTLLNSPWIKEEIKRELRKYFELKENETKISD